MSSDLRDRNRSLADAHGSMPRPLMAAPRRATTTKGALAALLGTLATMLVATPAARAAGPHTSAAAEAIVQFEASVRPADRAAAVRAAGGDVIRDLHVIHGLGARLSPRTA